MRTGMAQGNETMAINETTLIHFQALMGNESYEEPKSLVSAAPSTSPNKAREASNISLFVSKQEHAGAFGISLEGWSQCHLANTYLLVLLCFSSSRIMYLVLLMG